MSVTEQQARIRAASDLHVLLVAAGVTDEFTVKTWSDKTLWTSLLDFLWDMRLPKAIDESTPFIALLEAGAMKRLACLLIDFASLGRVQMWHNSYPNTVRDQHIFQSDLQE